MFARGGELLSGYRNTFEKLKKYRIEIVPDACVGGPGELLGGRRTGSRPLCRPDMEQPGITLTSTCIRFDNFQHKMYKNGQAMQLNVLGLNTGSIVNQLFMKLTLGNGHESL